MQELSILYTGAFASARKMGDVNKPLGLPTSKELMKLPTPDHTRIALVMRDLRHLANIESESSWKKRKRPITAYCRAVSTYLRHLAHALKQKNNPEEKCEI